MEEPSKHNQQTLVAEQPKPLDHIISESEKALGIETEYDRLAEASLFIDKKFLNYALITGVTQKPERVFGNEAWADYLDGRLFARQYGKRDLTIDFIFELHRKLTARSNPEISGQIRDCAVEGASYDDGDKPVTYTPEQVKAIEANPLLSFRREPPDDEKGTTGFIVYPHPESGAETQEAIAKDLQELYEWFNNAKKQDSYDPHAVAGLLQHRLISIHPFWDSNGRLSKMLMNWSLENDNEAPSVIDNPEEDILTDENTWISYITKGSKKYKAIKKQQTALEEAGINNIPALFDLGQDKAFYAYIFQYLKQTPPLPINGDKHKHQIYEEFLSDFKDEMNRFQQYMHGISKVKTADGEKEISQGGLITPEFMDFATFSVIPVLPIELRKQFFTDTEAYRGGMVDEAIDDEKLYQMFQDYACVGTGYRALERSYLSATSLQTVSQSAIRESMEYYNKMFASLYLAKQHPDIVNPYANLPEPIKNLSTTVHDHILGTEAVWNSPFASTSLSYQVSKGWAKNFWADYAKSSRHGVLIKTRLPKEGMIMTFGQKFEGLTASGIALEYEALIAGGIQPASITGIEIYDKGSISNNPSLTAKRIEKDGQVNIVIEDRHGEFVVSRTYTYSPDGAKFVLTGEEATDILSTTPIDQPPAFYPYAKQDFKQLIGTFKEKYISPFKNQNYSQLLTDSFFIKNTPEKQYNTIIPVKLPKNSEHNLTSIIKPSYIINPLGFGNKGYIPSLPPEKFKMTDFNYKMPEKSNSKIYWEDIIFPPLQKKKSDTDQK